MNIEIIDVPIDKLRHPEYQRARTNFGTLSKMRKGWDWNLFQPLDGARNADQTVNVIDGWTRKMALDEIGDVKNVPVRIHNLNYEEQARLFYDLHNCRTGIGSLDQHRSLIQAKDARALAIDEILSSHDLSFGKSKTGNQIGTVKTAYRIFDRSGERVFSDVLYVTHHAWPNTPKAYARELMYAIERLIVEFAGQVDLDRLVKKLSETTPVRVMSNGTVDGTVGEKGAEGVAYVMKTLYNMRLSPERKLVFGTRHIAEQYESKAV